MEITSEQLKALATEIAEERASELEDEFYQEVTADTFHKWFEATSGHKRPHLKRGVYFRDGRYFMLRRSKAPYKKYGKRFKPYPKEYYRQYDLAEKLMNMGIDSQTVVTEDGNTIEMKLGYSGNVPSEYKGFYVDYEGATSEERHYTMKNGKMSSLDRLIVRAAHGWARKQGLRINIESIFKEDNE